MKSAFLFWFFPGFLFTSCVTAVSSPRGASTLTPPAQPLNQQFLFERCHTTYRYGYRYDGIYVDGKGDLYTFYTGPKAVKWTPKNPYALTAQDLEAKCAPNRTWFGKIKPNVLQEQFAKIRTASLGKQSKKISNGAHYGKWQQVAYLYHPETKIYQKIDLRVMGAQSYHNLSPSAKELVDWLYSIDISALAPAKFF